MQLTFEAAWYPSKTQKTIIHDHMRRFQSVKLALKQINPVYTSILGKYKYKQCYGLNTHQAAALIIARRGLGFHQKLFAHNQGKRLVLVVPPMEGWTNKRIHRFSREIDEFTAPPSNKTSKMSGGFPQLLPRRQGSGGGIVPRSHTPTPGKSAPFESTIFGVYHAT